MSPRVLLLDNYDSFTHNLAQALEALGSAVEVVRNDRLSGGWLKERRPSHLVLSPGPGRPEAAGRMPEVLREACGCLPVLGVCLGHQALAQAFGGKVVRIPPRHGKTSAVEHAGAGVFRGLPSPFEAARYHSLGVDRDSLPEVLEATAWTPDGVLMGLRHRTLPLEGVQFHPESFLTPLGARLLANFLGL